MSASHTSCPTPARGVAVAPGASVPVDASFLSAVIETIPVGVWLLNPHGHIWLANAAAIRMWGEMRWVGPGGYGQYKAWWVDGGQPVKPEEWAAALVVESGHSVLGQRMAIQRPDGGMLTVRCSASPLRDGQGKPFGIVMISEDIDAEERGQAGLREMRDDLEAVLGALSSIFIVLDRDGKVRRWNAAATVIFGIPDEQTCGQRFRDIPLTWDWDMLCQAVPGLISDRTMRLESIRYVRQDGREGILAFTVSPIRHPDGTTDGCLWYGADVTERTLLEAQLHQAQRLESIGQLAAGIAHEINTPMQFIGDNHRFLADALGSMGKLIERLREIASRASAADRQALAEAEAEADLPWLQAEVPKALEQSQEGIARVGLIVKSMKEFSHPGSDDIVPVDLNHAIESTLVVSRNAWKYVAEMVRQFDPDLPLVPVQPGGFNQVILNLVVNAAHAIEDRLAGSGGKGTITIRTCRTETHAEVHVVDTGCGIPEAIRPRIFDPFFTTKQVGRGTGQGLAIVRVEVMERLGGELTFTSEVGIGTTFVIRLPLVRDSEERSATLDTGDQS
jgi:PAS domain S-box-containing protein